ncbi:Na(+)/H(+) exchange regulatory cofactor NHE-RF2-like [Acipenser ruthenus]|uniref:Na(+)/H(+) exchange regulatory cofactor NHE-RF2-like n=1 Tax=Acipenser ruthenus TaxID=7906 RepID=UPI002740874F|nr:Na(+)/H(+) exchange regulatory cofactor NHE-RF2-like [Acipenser ruthenus]
MAKDLKPRLCCMAKGENGYGFHLHGEKGKSGQFIRKVEANSPAEAAGMHAGDRVVEVNGVNVEKETHHQVVQRIKALEKETRLLVVDKETDEFLRGLNLACTEEMARSGVSIPEPVPVPQASVKGNGAVWKQQLALSSGEPKRLSRRHSAENRKKESHSQIKELHPRLCVLIRGETGYGFNLHSEKSKPGQYIRSVDTGSPADKAGLKTQDRLIEVNGVNIEDLKHSEVVAFIKSSGEEARLLVVDQEADEYFKKLGVTPTDSHVKDPLPQQIPNGSPKTQLNGSSTPESSRREITSPEIAKEIKEVTHQDPFAESGLSLSPTAAEAKEKAHAKRAKKRAPQMDWNKKHEIFSNF